MRTGVAGAAGARSLEVCDDDSGSSSQLLKVRQQEFAVRARRRAFALSASIEDVLVAAADRASDRLKRERPEFSAATLNKLAYFIPALFGVGALAGIAHLGEHNRALRRSQCFRQPSGFWLSCRRLQGGRAVRVLRDLGHEKRLPIYTVIAPLHREARVVDQLLSAIERLDYPAEKLDVIAYRRGRRAGNPRRNHATQTPSSRSR